MQIVIVLLPANCRRATFRKIVVEYLLQQSMTYAIGNQRLNEKEQSAIVGEVSALIPLCHQQVFNLKADSEARFIVVQYQNDLCYLRNAFTPYPSVVAVIETVIDKLTALYPGYILDSGSLSQEDSRLTIGFTVAELGLLLHLLDTQKLLISDNKKTLVRFFARHFKTIRMETISEDSLYGKYFKIDSATFESMKAKLIGMINLVNKMQKS